MKINFVAPMGFLGTSGYNNHCRGVINELGKIIDVKFSGGLPQNWNMLVNDIELSMISKQDDKDRINVILDLPYSWRLYTDKKVNTAYFIWEGSNVPLSFIEEFKNPDIKMIFIPSEKIRQAVKNTTTDSEILSKFRLVPHGVDRAVFYPEPKKDQTFRYLCNKGFRHPLDRSGIQFAIQAFIAEFTQENIELMIKFNPAYAMPPEAFNAFLMSLGHTGTPKISATWEAVEQKQLKELYNSCDVFLNPTCGEAFSIPNLEAFACGKPSITTKDQLDYTNKNNSWEVDYEPNGFEVQHEVLYQGIKWARPSIDSLRKAMREAFESRDVVEAKGAQALKDSKDLTWLNSASTLVQHLKDLV